MRWELLALVALVGCGGDPGTETPPDVSDEADADTDADADADADSDTDADADADTADTGPDPCALRVEIGNSVEGHAPITDGTPVTLVHGIQGGWHIDLSGLVGGTGPTVGVLATVVRASDQAPVTVTQPELFLQLAGHDGCTGTFSGERAVVEYPGTMAPFDFVCSLVGEELDVTIDVRDLDSGATTTSTVTVVGEADPTDTCP